MDKKEKEGPRISTIAAIGNNRELGKNNDLIWRIRADLKRVKELTTGHPIIMGAKTYESIGHPLPNRTNIVVSHIPIEIEGCLVFTDLGEAIEKAKEIDEEEIFIFGGASIYKATIDMVDRLYLTVINDEDSEADAHFPEYETQFTKVVSKEEHLDEDPPYTWVTLER